MSKRRHHHKHHHRHFDPRHERGAGVSYGMAGYGWGFGTAQSGIHDCLSGQQFPADSCPAATADAATGGGDAGSMGGGDAGAAS